MYVAEDDMPRYAKARDEVPFVVAALDGRHLRELGEGTNLARRFERLRIFFIETGQFESLHISLLIRPSQPWKMPLDSLWTSP